MNIFADTSGLFALLVKNDDMYVRASKNWDEYWQFHMELERSFYYHDEPAAMGVPDDFNELGMIEKNTTITARAA